MGTTSHRLETLSAMGTTSHRLEWHNAVFTLPNAMPEPNKYVSVAVLTPLRTTFQYLMPDAPVNIGSRVLVPFGRSRLTGIVISLDRELKVDSSKIRQVMDVYAPAADIPTPILRLCDWAARYYEHPPGDVFANAMPGMIRRGWDPQETVRLLRITDAGRAVENSSLQRAPAQKRALAELEAAPLLRDTLSAKGITRHVINQLVNKQWACWEDQKAAPSQPFTLAAVHTPASLVATAEQLKVIEHISGPGPFLLQGVTGSGKTEIYLRVMAPLLQQGRQVLVLVPEIGLTPQTVARFRDRFDVPIAVLHSSMTDRERALGWMRAREGAVGIVLGTRSAIFTPLKHPGAILVDEEHDLSYKQQDGFRYSARDLAVLRGQIENIPVLLGSATPSLESLHNVETGKYTLLTLGQRPPGSVAETYELLDTRHLKLQDGFTRALHHRIRDQLAKGEQVLVFINRRGFAPVLMCHDCSWVARCHRCDARLTYHISTNTLICHHCGNTSHNIISCHACGGSQVSAVGLGTQRVEQTLKEMFPGYPVMRIDRDSTRRKGAMEGFIEEVAKGEPAILVGTQLLAKGHHFPNVTLVTLLDVDPGFYSTDFRALERLGQLILQVGGRAGRADKPGRVLIQSAFTTHELLAKLVTEGYMAFARHLLAERKTFSLPPYTFNALIRADAPEASAAREFLEAIAKQDAPPSVQLLGPIPALMEKKADRYRQLLLLSAEHRPALHQELHKRVLIAEQSTASGKVRWSVDVDPVDLF